MTTWSVVKDDSRLKRRRGLLARVSLLVCLALVAVALGVALSPRPPQEPAEPPFSEQARSGALAETLRLRAAGEQLGGAPAGTGTAAVAHTVSLLTGQARGLLVPGQEEPALAPAPGPATPSDAGSPSAAAALPAAPLPASAAELATELADSASQRLADAAVADGGMARLLAAVGTAQLLEAATLAAAVGAPAPALPDPAAPAVSGICAGPSASALPEGAAGTASPAGSPAPSGTASAAASGGPSGAPSVAPSGDAASSVAPSGDASGALSPAASLPGALAATVETEREAVYGYQVALTRIADDSAGQASEQLTRHEALVTGAEALSRQHCLEAPLREAGYMIGPELLASPAVGLGALEASSLPVYGDLVAFSEGETRQWAISGLVGAARRTVLWGADAGILPGLTADRNQFPELPAPSPGP
jgi:hypothetical protein